MLTNYTVESSGTGFAYLGRFSSIDRVRSLALSIGSTSQNDSQYVPVSIGIFRDLPTSVSDFDSNCLEYVTRGTYSYGASTSPHLRLYQACGPIELPVSLSSSYDGYFLVAMFHNTLATGNAILSLIGRVS